MVKKALVPIFVISVLLVLGIYSFNAATPTNKSLAPAPQTLVSHDEAPEHASPPLPPEESTVAQASLKKMTQLLFDFTVKEKNLEELMTSLQLGHHEPYQVRDKNPDTGEMIIVRTKSPLPGTRYFHAQYFVDDNNQTFAQHISFEYRQSPEAMAQAITTVKANFPGIEAPMEESRDFIQWELPQGYVVWIKRLDEQDISNNPFNAYTEADIGSVRVAIELSPEADHDH